MTRIVTDRDFRVLLALQEDLGCFAGSFAAPLQDLQSGCKADCKGKPALTCGNIDAAEGCKAAAATPGRDLFSLVAALQGSRAARLCSRSAALQPATTTLSLSVRSAGV
jgi:hypothetical protein